MLSYKVRLKLVEEILGIVKDNAEWEEIKQSVGDNENQTVAIITRNFEGSGLDLKIRVGTWNKIEYIFSRDLTREEYFHTDYINEVHDRTASWHLSLKDNKEHLFLDRVFSIFSEGAENLPDEVIKKLEIRIKRDLEDLGKIAFWHRRGREYKKLLKKHREDGDDFYDWYSFATDEDYAEFDYWKNYEYLEFE